MLRQTRTVAKLPRSCVVQRHTGNREFDSDTIDRGVIDGRRTHYYGGYDSHVQSFVERSGKPSTSAKAAVGRIVQAMQLVVNDWPEYNTPEPR